MLQIVNSHTQGEQSEANYKNESTEEIEWEAIGAVPSMSVTAASSGTASPTSAITPPQTPHTNHCKSDPIGKSRNCSTAISKRYQFKRGATNCRVNDALREAVVSLKQVVSSVTTNGVTANSVTTNEFTVFGQGVGIQLAKLPINTALQLQLDIQSLVTKARLRAISESV